MFDIKKRKKFNTVGDLKILLDGFSDETKIAITGDACCWFHAEEDGSEICLDVEKLEYAYEEDDYEYVPSAANGDYGPSNPWDAPGMKISDFI